MLILLDEKLTGRFPGHGGTSSLAEGTYSVSQREDGSYGFKPMSGNIDLADLLSRHRTTVDTIETAIFWKYADDEVVNLLQYLAGASSANLRLKPTLFIFGICESADAAGAMLEKLAAISTENGPASGRFLESVFFATSLDESGEPIDQADVLHCGKHFMVSLFGGGKGAEIMHSLGAFRTAADESLVNVVGMRSWVPSEEDLFATAREIIPLAFHAGDASSQDSEVSATSLASIINKAANRIAHDSSGNAWRDGLGGLGHLNRVRVCKLPELDLNLDELEEKKASFSDRKCRLWRKSDFEAFAMARIGEMLATFRGAIESERQKIVSISEKMRREKVRILKEEEAEFSKRLVASRKPAAILRQIGGLTDEGNSSPLEACSPLRSPSTADLVTAMRKDLESRAKEISEPLTETAWEERLKRTLMGKVLPIAGIMLVLALACIAFVPVLRSLFFAFLDWISSPKPLGVIGLFLLLLVGGIFLARKISSLRRRKMMIEALDDLDKSVSGALQRQDAALRAIIDRNVALEQRSLGQMFRGFVTPTIAILREVALAFIEAEGNDAGKSAFKKLKREDQSLLHERSKELLEEALGGFETGKPLDEIQSRFRRRIRQLGWIVHEKTVPPEDPSLRRDLKRSIAANEPRIWAPLDLPELNERVTRLLVAPRSYRMDKIFDGAIDSRYEHQEAINLPDDTRLAPLLIKTRRTLDPERFKALIRKSCGEER